MNRRCNARRPLVASVMLAALAAASSHAAVIHVDIDAPSGGDGLSWATAFRDLQDGLAAAVGTTDEIWIAEGTYRPDRGTGFRSRAFHLLPGVTLLGGFEGTESTAAERVISMHPTVLSGDLLNNDSPEFANTEDNSYHVLTAINLNDAAGLDGLIIRGGRANGYFIYDRGAGLFGVNATVNATACIFDSHQATNGGAIELVNTDLVLDGCVVSNSTATYGAGIRSADSDLTLTATSIIDNVALDTGGGINCTGGTLSITGGSISANAAPRQAIFRLQSGQATLTDVSMLGNVMTIGGTSGAPMMLVDASSGPLAMMNCEASDNVGVLMRVDVPLSLIGVTCSRNSGSAPMIDVTAGDCAVSGATFDGNDSPAGLVGVLRVQGNVTVADSQFTNNSGNVAAAISSFGHLTLSDTLFIGNSGTAALAQTANLNVQVSRCEFIGNTGISGFAAALQTASSANGWIEDCLFEGNGGSEATVSTGGNIDILRCTFRNNTAAGYSGATRSIIDCDFIGNTYVQGAGATINGSSSLPPTYLLNCRFMANHATSTSLNAGSGALCVNGVGNGNGAIVVNSTFAGNTAAIPGGGAFCLGGTMELVNASFYGNTAAIVGGGIHAYKGTTRVRNCLLWSNGGSSQGAQLSKGGNGTLVVSNTSLQGWTGSYGGTANNGNDPQFVHPLGDDQVSGTEDDDLTLSPGSPAIDTGNSAYLPADLFDLDGDGNVVEPVPFDLAGLLRVVTILDRGAFEKQAKADQYHTRTSAATGAAGRASNEHRRSATTRIGQ